MSLHFRQNSLQLMSVALFVAEVVVPTLIRTGNGSRGGDGYSGGVEAGDVSGVGDGVKGDFGGGDDRENDDGGLPRVWISTWRSFWRR